MKKIFILLVIVFAYGYANAQLGAKRGITTGDTIIPPSDLNYIQGIKGKVFEKLSKTEAASIYLNKDSLTAGSGAISDYFYTKIKADSINLSLLSNDYRNRGLKELGFGGNVIYPLSTVGLFSSAAYAVVDGTCMTIAYYLPKKLKILGVKWVNSVAGSVTTDNYNGFGLYSSVAGSGIKTKIDSTANDANLWATTAATVSTKDFVVQDSIGPGIVYLQQVSNWSAGTQPQVYTISVSNAIFNRFLTNSNKLSATKTATATTKPTLDISGYTETSTIPGYLLYY